MGNTKRKTRLKGTESKKPCFACGKTKDRLKDFKPRWAGCNTHRTETGRRFNQAGCASCAALVNGNIRQPRCITCDKARPKKPAGTPVVPAIAAVEAVAVAAPESPIEVVIVDAPGGVQDEIKSGVMPEEPKVGPVVVSEAPSVEPTPVAVATPEPAEEPAPESVVVVVPPVVVSTPKPAPRKVSTKSDLFALFAGEDSPAQEETPAPF